MDRARTTSLGIREGERGTQGSGRCTGRPEFQAGAPGKVSRQWWPLILLHHWC